MKENHKQFLFHLGLIIALFTSFSVVHELTHKTVAENYNCQNTSIDYTPSIEEGYFMATFYSCPDLTKQEALHLKSDQNMVEAVGYQLFAALVVLLSVLYANL